MNLIILLILLNKKSNKNKIKNKKCKLNKKKCNKK